MNLTGAKNETQVKVQAADSQEKHVKLCMLAIVSRSPPLSVTSLSHLLSWAAVVVATANSIAAAIVPLPPAPL